MILRLTILMFFIANAANAADEAKELDMRKMALDLAECGGVFSAMGSVLKDLDKEKAAQTYNDVARGAYMAGAYSNYMVGNITEWKDSLTWAENIKAAEENSWLGLFELFTPTKDEFLPDEFIQKLDFCSSLNPVQTEIVNMMREQMYFKK